jgi:radical SAM protein with 4Fe4S-binding SPASM domain
MDFKKWLGQVRLKTRELLKPNSPTLSAGLFTYPVKLDGGQRRIHLRIGEDGAGVLFVDVTDVIHLNQTAARMAKLALDGIPQNQAKQYLLRQYRGVSQKQLISDLTSDLHSMYEMVNRLREDVSSCPTCSISPLVSFKPVFSTPVTAPFKADIALTYACNNACPHCYNEAGRFTMPSLSPAEWQRVLDTLSEIGVPHIILTGGEPTLHPELVNLIRYADQLGLVVGMNTNGRLLAQPEFTQAISNAGLNHAQITLESWNQDVHDAMVNAPGAFQQTVEGIKNAVACGIHTITNTTLTRQNQHNALETVDFLYNLGLRTFAMNGMIYAGGGRADHAAIPSEEMAVLLDGVRERAETLNMRFLWYTVTDYCRFNPLELGLSPKRCNAGEYSMCIEPNGDVLPCQSYYVSAGNILSDSWESIWNSDLFLSFRNRESDPEAAGLAPECTDCPDLEICGGGCRLEHEAQAVIRPAERGCARSRLSVPQRSMAGVASQDS